MNCFSRQYFCRSVYLDTFRLIPTITMELLSRNQSVFGAWVCSLGRGSFEASSLGEVLYSAGFLSLSLCSSSCSSTILNKGCFSALYLRQLKANPYTWCMLNCFHWLIQRVALLPVLSLQFIGCSHVMLLLILNDRLLCFSFFLCYKHSGFMVCGVHYGRNGLPQNPLSRKGLYPCAAAAGWIS